MINRRQFDVFLLGALAAAFAAPGARAQETPPKTPEAAKPGVDGAREALLAAQQKFGAHLLAKVARGQGRGAPQNLCVSPLSALSALTTIADLGDKAFVAALLKTTRFSKKAKSDPKALLASLREKLKSLAADGGALTSADRLLIDAALQLPAEVVEKLRAQTNFEQKNLAEAAIVEETNAWVNEKTKSLIPAILDRPPGAGGLVALNALYFKDRWQTPFDPANTAAEPFTDAEGKSEPTQMMNRAGKFRARRDAKISAVDLPFGDGRYSIVLATNNDKPARAAELLANGEKFLGGAEFEETPGEIAVPRLDLSAAAELLAPLVELGLKNGPLVALGPKPPRISNIAQRAALKMDETGAEAAAATAIVATRSFDERFVKIRFDKPFVFALRDTQTGFIVLTGYVARP